MQWSGVLVFALAVAGTFAVPISQDNDRMKDLLSAVSDFVLAQTAKLKPLHLHDVHRDTSHTPILSRFVSANITMTNNTYDGYTALAVENLNSYPGHLVGEMDIRHPKIAFEGNYELKGEVLNFEVAEGAGNYSVEYVNMTYSFKNIQLVEIGDNKTLRVVSLGIELDLEDDKFQVTGLKIQGVPSTPDFEKNAELVIKQIFEIKKRPTAILLEVEGMTHLNSLIGNRTLEQVVEYLKEHKDYDYTHPAEHHMEMLTQLFKV